MKKLLVLGALLVVLATLAFCGGIKEGTPVDAQGAHAEYHVMFLFEADGVKIYRFEDNDHYHYFAVSAKSMAQVSDIETSGKTTIQHESVIVPSDKLSLGLLQLNR